MGAPGGWNVILREPAQTRSRLVRIEDRDIDKVAELDGVRGDAARAVKGKR